MSGQRSITAFFGKRSGPVGPKRPRQESGEDGGGSQPRKKAELAEDSPVKNPSQRRRRVARIESSSDEDDDDDEGSRDAGPNEEKENKLVSDGEGSPQKQPHAMHLKKWLLISFHFDCQSCFFLWYDRISKLSNQAIESIFSLFFLD